VRVRPLGSISPPRTPNGISKGAELCLWNEDCLSDPFGAQLIVTEGEIDGLSCLVAGVTPHVTSVPNGAALIAYRCPHPHRRNTPGSRRKPLEVSGCACRQPLVVDTLAWPRVASTSAVDRVRAVGVPQRVRRYSLADAGLPGRALDHAVDGPLGQVAAFAAGEHGIVGAGIDGRAPARGTVMAWRRAPYKNPSQI
jgi:hypothetical protein